MDKLIIQPTAMAEWHSLVLEAEVASSLELGEELESYLVFLLLRFSARPEMAQSILALEFLQSLHTLGEKRLEQLRDLGDKCLLFSGLFPGVALRRRVNNDYFVALGQSAYGVLADNHSQTAATLYTRLSACFEALSFVLKNMREIQHKKTLPNTSSVFLKKLMDDSVIIAQH